MNLRYVTGTLLLAIAGVSTVAAQRWRGALPPQTLFASQVGAAQAGESAVDADSLDRATDDVVNDDPFRIARVPSVVPFVSQAKRSAMQAAPPPPRPSLVLRGIVGGPPWTAIVDGLPGTQPGTLVRTGDVFDRLSVRAITRDTVVVQSPDTTWRLTMVPVGSRP